MLQHLLNGNLLNFPIFPTWPNHLEELLLSTRQPTPQQLTSDTTGQCNCQQNKNHQQGTSGNHFQRRCEELKEHGYDSRLSNELFTRTMKEIAEYVTCEYSSAGDSCMGLIDMAFQPLPLPPAPDPADTLQVKLWKLELKDYHKKLEDQECNMSRVFALILGQCSPTV